MQIKDQQFRRVTFGATVALAALMGSTGQGASDRSTCAAMRGVLTQAHTKFEATNGDAPMLPGAATCSLSTGTAGKQSHHCGWAFGYRSSAATRFFDELHQEIQQCWPTTEGTQTEPGVNHPDSYHLHKYALPEGHVTLSIKDKAALQQTYVFLGITPSD